MIAAGYNQVTIQSTEHNVQYSFTANFDTGSGVIYGDAGGSLVTISLCGQQSYRNPQIRRQKKRLP
jgi:phage gp45-like